MTCMLYKKYPLSGMGHVSYITGVDIMGHDGTIILARMSFHLFSVYESGVIFLN